MTLAPIKLPMNRPHPRPYRGGVAIERFRGLPESGDEWAPEDFLASTVTTFGSSTSGLTEIDGVFLRDLIAEDPVGWLGEEHVAKFGANPMLLCKLLHTGERLFVHAHPDAGFAARHLGAPTGKTEAWIILDCEPGAKAWLGFKEDVSSAQLMEWFESQDSAAMLDALNEVELHAGDTLFVPAGVPHAIGAGVLLLELQEPADLSVILEYAPFERLKREDGLLGMDAETALGCIERGAFDVGAVIGKVPDAAGVTELFPPEAGAFFRAEAITVRGGEDAVGLAGFAIIVVADGKGTAAWAQSDVPLAAGDVVLAPHGTGELPVSGGLHLIRCLPPRAVDQNPHTHAS